MFEVIIDNEKAFDLDVPNSSKDSQESIDFYNLLKSNPSVVIIDNKDVQINDLFIDGAFYRNGNKCLDSVPSLDKTFFAFIVNNCVVFIQSILNSAEMLIAAYSSSPVFKEI
jgi:hypothetical protein